MNTFTPSGFKGGRFRPRRQEESHRINDRIIAKEVRLISDDGQQIGVVPLRDAINMAEQAGLDLVEVSSNTTPPVCKLLDYGKFKYREQKKEAQARKKRSEIKIKELRIRYATDSGDVKVKIDQARRFLGEGDKVKFTMRFRGREIEHTDLGREKLDMLIGELSDIAVVDEKSPSYGRTLYVIMAPQKK